MASTKISNGVNHAKKLQGEVVSNKMDKTAVIKIAVLKKHPKYHKRYMVYKRYKAHDEKNEYQVGDIVEIQESRPLSKEKRWVVVKKVK